MSTQALFKKLTAGIKFDTKKFSAEACKFGLTQKTEQEGVSDDTRSKVDIPVYSEVKAEIKEKMRKEKLKTGSDDDEAEITVIGNIKTAQKKKNKRKTKSKVREAYQEKLNQFRNSQNIHVSGTDIPEPFNTWSTLSSQHGVSDKLLSCLQFPTPTPVQMQAIPVLLQGRELLACAPTGSGKTAAFLIPIIQRLLVVGASAEQTRDQAGMMSPTRKLAMQIKDETRKFCSGSRLMCPSV